jgi:hypothetical protein
MLAADASDPRARYVAIIADGNARWARAHGLPVDRGHDASADTLKALIADAIAFGVQELTIYSFSTENWMRPAREVQALIAMFTRRIAQETPGLHEAVVQMRFIGCREDISEQLAETMRRRTADGCQREPHALHSDRLRRTLRDPRRRAKLPWRHRRGVPGAALRTRDARPRADDPHRRRATPLQLSALAMRRLRAGLPRRALARLHPQRPRPNVG